MKFKELPDLTAMYQKKVEALCKKIDGKVTFVHIGNGKYEYSEVRVVRYKIIDKGSGEELLVELTGFPTIDHENI